MTPEDRAAGREVAARAAVGKGPAARWIRNAVDDTFERHGADLIERTNAIGLDRKKQIEQCAILLQLQVAEWLIERYKNNKKEPHV